MAASLTDILASLDNGVRAINTLALQVTNSLTNIPISLAALSTATYATGLWTPNPTFATPGDLAAAGSFLGTWVKWGPQIYAGFDIVSSTWTFTTSSGSFQVQGLPFTSAPIFRGSGSWSHLTGLTAYAAGTTFASPRVEPSATLFEIALLGTVTVLANSTGHFTSGTNLIMRGYVQYTTTVST